MPREQIVDGSSLSGTSIQEMSNAIKTNRNCTIQITNHSEHDLTDPSVYSQSGYCYAPPQPIIEGKTRDACSFSKTGDTATGAVGVLTYRLGDSHTRFALMFSVPYDFNLYSSWFGLAFVDVSVPTDEELYKEMYYGKECADKPDRKRAKAKDGITLQVERNDWKICATMSEAKKSIIHIEIMNTPVANIGACEGVGHHHHSNPTGWNVMN